MKIASDGDSVVFEYDHLQNIRVSGHVNQGDWIADVFTGQPGGVNHLHFQRVPTIPLVDGEFQLPNTSNAGQWNGSYSGPAEGQGTVLRHGPPQYDAKYVSQTPDLTLPHNGTGTVQFTMKNTGTQTWTQSTNPFAVKVGTQSPQDGASPFFSGTGTWLSSSRVRMDQDNIPPGSTVTFTISILVAPDLSVGSHTQWLRMLAEGKTRFGDTVGVTVNVRPAVGEGSGRQQDFINAYNLPDIASHIGLPTNTAYWWSGSDPNNTYKVVRQDFDGDPVVILSDEQAAANANLPAGVCYAYPMTRGMFAFYTANGGGTSVYGVPTSAEWYQGNHEPYQSFSKGYLDYNRQSFTAWPTSGNGWRVEYFNNQSIACTPTWVTYEDTLNFDHNWSGNSPASGVFAEKWSTRYTRNMTFNATKYTFTIDSDDGASVYLDGTQILDNWTCCGLKSVTIDVTAGIHAVMVIYRGDGSPNYLKFSLAPVNQPPTMPTLSSPADGASFTTNAVPQLCWNASTDPDAGATIQYYVDVTGSATLNSGWQSATCWTPSTLAGQVGSYSWKVKARDNNGAESQFSTARTFSLVANPATKLAFGQQPSNAIAGVGISPAVTVLVQNAQGNTATTYTGAITLTLTNANGATLGGTATVNAVNGVATFSNLSITKIGTGYSLSATASGVTGVTSSNFNIMAANATKLLFTTPPGNATAGSLLNPQPIVGAFDSYGNPTPAFSGNVSLSITTGTGTSGATLGGTTVATINSGVATFTDLHIDSVGTGYTLTAAASGVSSTTSSAFSIAASPATQLVYEVQPGNSSAGSPLAPQPRLVIKDAGGNVATSYNGTVTLMIKSGTGGSGATLAGTTTVPVSNGRASFSDLHIDKVGSGYVLTATGSGLAITDSSAFSIAPATASTLTFSTQPSGATAGAALSSQPVVSAYDAYGNAATAFGGTITLTLNGGTSGASLGGTNPVSAVNGVATFAGLSVSQAGTGYSLTARASGLTTATSTPFTIQAPPLTVPTPPTNSIACVLSKTQASVLWTDTSNNEDGFIVERQFSTREWVEAGRVGANIQSFTDSGLKSGKVYNYRVSAFNAAGTSVPTSIAAVKMVKAAAPKRLYATTAPGVVTLAWQDVAMGECGYVVERRLGNGKWAQIGQAAPNDTTYTDTTASPLTPYSYRVRAYNGMGNSGYSNVVKAITPA